MWLQIRQFPNKAGWWNTPLELLNLAKAFKHNTIYQFVIFKPLNYCFEETIGFYLKASFASLPLSRLIRWYNKPGHIIKKLLDKASVPRDFSWIENYKLISGFHLRPSSSNNNHLLKRLFDSLCSGKRYKA